MRTTSIVLLGLIALFLLLVNFYGFLEILQFFHDKKQQEKRIKVLKVTTSTPGSYTSTIFSGRRKPHKGHKRPYQTVNHETTTSRILITTTSLRPTERSKIMDRTRYTIGQTTPWYYKTSPSTTTSTTSSTTTSTSTTTTLPPTTQSTTRIIITTPRVYTSSVRSQWERIPVYPHPRLPYVPIVRDQETSSTSTTTTSPTTTSSPSTTTTSTTTTTTTPPTTLPPSTTTNASLVDESTTHHHHHSHHHHQHIEVHAHHHTTTTTPAPHHQHVHHVHHKHHNDTEQPRQRQPAVTTMEPEAKERNATIVTALMDIGRGDWWEYRRPLDKYHMFMENVLSLRNYLVIFTDEASYSFIHKYRKNLGLMHKTRIHQIQISDLPLYRYIDDARRIIDTELKSETFYKTIGEAAMKNHPEAKSAEYDIVVNSKTYFLHNTTLENPFETDHFVWIDAGYGHGNQSVFPYNNLWRPVFPNGRVSLIKLTPEYDKMTNYNLDNLYRKNWAVLSGGFIAGDKHSIGQLHSMVHRKFIQLIYQDKVDDDQTVLVLVVNAYPHLFNIVLGDWFDAFKSFSIDAEAQFG